MNEGRMEQAGWCSISSGADDVQDCCSEEVGEQKQKLWIYRSMFEPSHMDHKNENADTSSQNEFPQETQR